MKSRTKQNTKSSPQKEAEKPSQQVSSSPESSKGVKMFVGGLDPSTTQEQLLNYFQTFGVVSKVKIVGEAQGKSRGFGFIHFASQKVLERVCRQSHVIEGREVDCKLAKSEMPKEKQEKGLEKDQPLTKIFIKDIPLDLQKSDLHGYFSRFGEVEEVLLILRKNKKKAFSYVRFKDPEDALQSVQVKEHAVKPGVEISCVLALPKNSKELSLPNVGPGNINNKKETNNNNNFKSPHPQESTQNAHHNNNNNKKQNKLKNLRSTRPGHLKKQPSTENFPNPEIQLHQDKPGDWLSSLHQRNPRTSNFNSDDKNRPKLHKKRRGFPQEDPGYQPGAFEDSKPATTGRRQLDWKIENKQFSYQIPNKIELYPGYYPAPLHLLSFFPYGIPPKLMYDPEFVYGVLYPLPPKIDYSKYQNHLNDIDVSEKPTSTPQPFPFSQNLPNPMNFAQPPQKPYQAPFQPETTKYGGYMPDRMLNQPPQQSYMGGYPGNTYPLNSMQGMDNAYSLPKQGQGMLGMVPPYTQDNVGVNVNSNFGNPPFSLYPFGDLNSGYYPQPQPPQQDQDPLPGYYGAPAQQPLDRAEKDFVYNLPSNSFGLKKDLSLVRRSKNKQNKYKKGAAMIESSSASSSNQNSIKSPNPDKRVASKEFLGDQAAGSEKEEPVLFEQEEEEEKMEVIMGRVDERKSSADSHFQLNKINVGMYSDVFF